MIRERSASSRKASVECRLNPESAKIVASHGARSNSSGSVLSLKLGRKSETNFGIDNGDPENGHTLRHSIWRRKWP